MKTFIGYTGIARMIPVAFLAALSAGCGVETASEDDLAELGVSEEAIGEASCATATADVTLLATPGEEENLYWFSSRTYSNPKCYKALVFDLINLEVGNASNSIYARWADTVPTTQTECNRLWLQMYIYAHIDGVWEKVDLGTARGAWSASNFKCQPPEMSLTEGLVADGIDGDNAYRIVVGARSDGTSSAPTRRFHVHDAAL